MPLVEEAGEIEVWIFIEDEPEKAARTASFYDRNQNELILNLDDFKVLKVDDEASGRLVNMALRYLYANRQNLIEIWDRYNPRG